jgi:hypothetical protein
MMGASLRLASSERQAPALAPRKALYRPPYAVPSGSLIKQALRLMGALWTLMLAMTCRTHRLYSMPRSKICMAAGRTGPGHPPEA